MNADCEILTSFFNDTSIIHLEIGSRIHAKETKAKTRLQKLKDLGLLGAIKESEITSENYKEHLKEYFGNSCE